MFLHSAERRGIGRLVRLASSKLNFMWATPRSVSTAFGRCMAAHPLVQLIHEPFTETYYFGPERRSTRYGDVPDQDLSCAHAAQHVNQRLRAAPGPKIFVKELAFQGEPYVEQGLFEESSHALIARRPLVVAASLRTLKPDFSEDEFGFTALARIYERCLRSKKEVVVIDGDLFRARPRQSLTEMCTRMGIEFSDTMLSWDGGSVRIWQSHEQESQAKWHRTLEQSTRILPPETLRTDPRDGMDTAQREIIGRAEVIYNALFPASGTPSLEGYQPEARIMSGVHLVNRGLA